MIGHPWIPSPLVFNPISAHFKGNHPFKDYRYLHSIDYQLFALTRLREETFFSFIVLHLLSSNGHSQCFAYNVGFGFSSLFFLLIFHDLMTLSLYVTYDH